MCAHLWRLSKPFLDCDAATDATVDWHSAGEWLISWHWGSVLTVLVAIGAIGVSAWANRRTLRQSADINSKTLQQSADQFRRQRLDEREDKLRTEIAQIRPKRGDSEGLSRSLLSMKDPVDPEISCHGRFGAAA
jgi:hypothetical protein